MSGMADVLAAHRNLGLAFRNAESGALYDCSCRRRFNDFSEHLADALSAAGFGPVKEAGAEALEEAAYAITKPQPDYDGTPARFPSNWLKARAAAVRGEG